MSSPPSQQPNYAALSKSALLDLLSEAQSQAKEHQQVVQHQSKILKQRDHLIRAQQQHIEKI